MKILKHCRGQRDDQRGYALLFVLFLMVLILIGASTAVLDSYTQGQREKEKMMIWRGEQYQRAVGMFYRKFGRFPTSIDDLVKEQNGNIRFLREAYKNPMNKEDGSWRFIYVTPAGLLIGSVRYVSLQQMAFLDKQRQMGLAAGTAGKPSDDSGSGSGEGTSGTGAQPLASPGGSNFTNGSVSGATPPQMQGQLQNPQTSGSSSFLSQPLQMQSGANGGFTVNEQSSSIDDTGQVIGGFIIGVAGKEDRPSVKVYKGGVTYKQWEFIFNPLEQVQTIGTISTGPQNPVSSPNMQAPPIPQQPQQQPQPQPQQQ